MVREGFIAAGLYAAMLALTSTSWAQTPTPAPKPAAAPVYVWQNVEILGGGFVPGVVFHPTEKGLVYARTDIGGAYRYDPLAGRWVQMLDFLGRADSQLYGVLSIGLDPQNPDRVYLAAGEYLGGNARKGAILISKDRGKTFTKTELPFWLGGNADGRSTGERLVVDPKNPQTLWLGTSRDGLWRSDDGALNWTKTTLPAEHVLWVLPDGKGGLYAGVEAKDGKSFYASQDNGLTWATVAGTPKGLMPHHAEFDAGGKLFMTFADAPGPNGVKDGAVRTYDPDNGHWFDITPLKPSSETFGYAGLSLDRQKPGTLVVSTLNRWGSGDEIFRSTDSGKSWKPLSEKSAFETSQAPWLLPYAGGKHDHLGHWIGDIDIDPFDSSRVFYVTGYGLWENRELASIDSGAKLNWRFTNQGLEETAVLELISPPTGAPVFSALGDIGGFRHDDLTSAQNSTYFHPNGVHTRGMDFAEDKPSLIVRTSDRPPFGYYSEDGGKTWTGFASHPVTVTGNDYQTMGIGVSADGASWVWMPAKSEPYVSTDKGQTWVKSSGAPVNSEYHIFPIADRVNPKKFYLYDNRKKTVYASEDGGLTFKVATTSAVDWGGRMRAAPGNEGHLWVGGWNGLNVSDDGGKTFTTMFGIQEAWAVAFGKSAPGETYPALFVWGKLNDREGLYFSSDLGGRWVRLTTPSKQFGSIRGVMAGDPKVFGRLYIGTDGRGVLYGDFKLPEAAK
ncbi:sialidase family protein [Asticcacaulis machinosus]|uniref:Exo-alpha-sialidase n=1 Tax=Asticcacaulis machinosus TaxID=2984211 RepID=A0ABT5HIH3_9CAUL|nr:sialidase family protein [Asticcacaulis machinosus]MDC7675940.1 exo-alpha-sialidase [Asticcacaulis machinosus]